MRMDFRTCRYNDIIPDFQVSGAVDICVPGKRQVVARLKPAGFLTVRTR